MDVPSMLYLLLVFSLLFTSVESGCRDITVNLNNKLLFPDYLFTATSEYDDRYVPKYARFSSPKGWGPHTSGDASDYLQIDLGRSYKICAVATRSARDVSEWVTQYKLQFSQDNANWDIYKENNVTKVFTGNSDRSSRIKNDVLVNARFMRLQPTAFYSWKTVRVEIYGTPEGCSQPLEIRNRGVGDAQMTSSSNLDNDHAASRGRLFGEKSWCSSTASSNEYLQVDLGRARTVTGIATQGDKTDDKWVEAYTISYSQDGSTWSDYTDGQSSRIVLIGNTNRDEVRANLLTNRISARYFRVYPQTWNTEICMRMELYGCPDEICDNNPLGLESGTIQDSQMSASSQYNTTYLASNARLNYTGGPSWCASTSDTNPYLQIDLGSPHVICAVATQGNFYEKQWTKYYTLQGSLDETTFDDYLEGNTKRIFDGNFDQNTVVKLSLNEGLVARYVRFLPVSVSHGAYCIRAEIYGIVSSVCQHSAVGIRVSSNIQDFRMTASSYYDSRYTITSGRLYSSKGWAPKARADDDYLQIDIGAMHVLCALATQGHAVSSEWSRTYNVSLSVDGVTWKIYEENDAQKVFTANTDKNTVVKQTMAKPTAAKYIRFYPKTYNSYKALRVEVYGLRKECRSSLGVERFMGIDPVTQLSSSSQLDAAHSAANGRLYGASAWCATNTNNHYIQLDLLVVMSVTGVVTQGDADFTTTRWVQTYDVQFGYSTSRWFMVKGIQGNTDSNSTVANWFRKPIGARYVRILPRTWSTSICLRMDVYGCKQVAPPDVETVQAVTNLTASIGSSGQISCSVYALPNIRVTWKQDQTTVASSSQISYQNGFANSILRVNFTNADDYGECSDPASGHAACSRKYTCEVFYDNMMNGPADTKDGKVFVELDVPSTPTSVTVGSILDNSVLLTWSQPPPTIRQATVGQFKVEYNVEGEQRVFQDTTGGDSRSHVIGGLLSNTSYVVKLSAVSQVGDGTSVTQRFQTLPTIFCEDRTVGMELGLIPDPYITASSQMNSSTRPSNARLHFTSGSSWCASTGDSDPYLQIDLGSPHMICAVATQGNSIASQWVTSYSLLFSDDGINWRYLLEQDRRKVLPGNTDKNTVMKHVLETRPSGRLIRFIPRGYHDRSCLRVELYGRPSQKECADISVGLSSANAILDHRFTASTSYGSSEEYKPYGARFGGSAGWAAGSNNDRNDYLQIDLGSVHRICAVATLGSAKSNELVTKYKLFLSMDNAMWTVYKVNGSEKVFPGNVDRNVVVKNQLTEAVSAKFIRFNPTDKIGHKTMRVEVYGVPQDCTEPLGIENRGVEDARMMSSSHLDNNHVSSRGRLYGDNSWCSSTASSSEYLQVDLGSIKTVSGIATQGDSSVNKWIKTFALSYSINGVDWTEYKAGKTITKVLNGNNDKSTVAVNWLPYPFNARYVRVIPLTWNAGPCLRFDLYGCSVSCANQAAGLQQGLIPDSQISASSVHNTSTVARNARLHYTSGSSWCASTSDTNPYLQIDLGSPHIICAVATQGDHFSDNLVETYQIQGSSDGSTFTDYNENSAVKTFAGNYDRNSVIKQIMKNLFIARYIRFLPKSYDILPCMRVEVYASTTSQCVTQPVGLRAGSSIRDYRLTASSVYSADYPISFARLYASKAWATKTKTNSNDFVQVDLGSMYAVCSVATQGSPISNEWTETYKMSTSLNGKTWSPYSESGSTRIFTGNTDRNTVVKNNLFNVVTARFVRIYPMDFNSHKDLRFEVYGIRHPWAVPLGLETGSIADNQLTATSSYNSSHVAAHARLYGVSSWCKSLSSTGETYLQVDLRTVLQISGIATQGNAENAWVTSYDLGFSYSTSNWQNRSNIQGNVDKNGLVIYTFNQQFSARYLRLRPRTEQVVSCVRMEVYGNKLVARPEILDFTGNTSISGRKGSWVEYKCTVNAQEFVTILWKHGNRILSSSSTYNAGTTLSTLILNYTNGDDFAATCRQANLSSQASECNSTITCQAFYDYLLSDGSVKRVGTVYTEIKVPLAPGNVTFVKIRHHSAQVHWIPGEVTIDRASVRYFNVRYYPVNYASRVLNMTLRASKRMAHIGGLDANTSYVVQIRAVSIAGEGSWVTEYFTTVTRVSCSKKDLGMADKTIPDVYITSSSKRDNSSKASFGRLNHLSSWCASASDSSPYLQVDLGMLYVICATATQGNPGNDEWVRSYEMRYARDGINWRPVLEKSDIKIFSGNQDRSSVVIQEIPEQLVARSVRVVPKTSNGSACLRIELYGEPYHPGCAEVPIGVDSPSTIPDHRFTASSYFSVENQPSKARLGGDSAWRPRTDTDPDDYLQIDLGTIYTICVIQTDGQSPTDRVLSYVVYYSLDNQDWDVLVDPWGMIKVFNNTRTKLENKISARFVRLFPGEYSGHKSLRVQLYGVAEVCKESLGVENKGIENNQMTSSTHHGNTHTASHGRLYGDSSWCSSTSSLAEFIQIDLGNVKTIRGIAIQGDHVTDKWVKTYTVGYSMDGLGYKVYTGGTGKTKVFPGNTDRNSVVVNWLRYPINARYVRISSQDWNGAICLRVDLYGCQATCSNTPLGLESGTIPDSQMSASSQYNINYPASNARLHYTGGPSWCASKNDPDPYLQIDLGSPHVICAVATQGDNHGDHWVEKYTVKGSFDGITWGSEMEFIANSDRNTQVKHDITVAMTTRFVRFLPTRSYGNACMRVELYGTTLGGCSKEPIGVRWGGSTKDHKITSSSNNGPESLPYMARLHGPRGWSPRTTTNDSDFLQIDLGSVYLVCGVATQGGGERSQWAASYTLATSLDGSTWATVKENNTDKVFPGNTDSSTVVKNSLSQATVAKFVRLYPRTYHAYKRLRLEVYGIQHGCRQGLGMENGRIQDSQLSAWSSLNKNLSNANTSRLYSHSAWNGGVNPVGSYVQVDLVDARMITGIATQGSSLHDKWVDSYLVKFGFSTSFWYQIRNFKGNKDGHDVRVNWLSRPLGTVFVRIFPLHWKSTPYLRVDLYGCERVASPRVITVSQDANLTAINGSAVTLTCSIYGEPFTSIGWRNSTNDVTRFQNTPSHRGGRVHGNITVLYTSAEIVYNTYECQRVKESRTVRCWTPYTCFAYYTQYTNEGFDERSIRVFVNLTLPDAPPKPSTSKMNSTSVTITWHRPDPGDGSILSYKIKYGEYGSNITRIVNSTSTGNNTQSIRLKGLEPYTRYNVTVIPVGSIGDGMESTPTVFVTYLRTSIYLPSSQLILQTGQTNVTLQCYGRGYPPPNVTWTKDGLPVSSNQHIDFKLSETNISSQLILGNQSGVTYQEAGNYTCHVVNHVDGLGPISSIIEVIFTPDVKVTPSQISSVEGTAVTFQCTAVGVPLPVISWNFNGGQLPNNTQIKNNSLVIKGIVNTAANEGTYACVATSRAGVAESSANLTVWVLPKILPPLKNITVMVGSMLNITCVVSGEPLPDVTWTKDNMTNVTAAEYSERGTRLVIRSVTVRDEGVYMCNASSKAGWTVSSAFLTIRAAEEAFIPQPYTRSYTKNQLNITADCYGRGYPKPTVTWLRDNQTILRVKYLTSNDTGRVVQMIRDDITEPLDNVTSRLYLRTAGIMYRDAGNYTCRVSNGVGAEPAEKKLEILLKPEFVFTSSDKIGLTGSNVTFSCFASGVPKPSIGWMFNNGDVSVPHWTTDTNITLIDVKNNNLYEGNYTCMATSRAGTDRHTVQLVVDVPSTVVNIKGNTSITINTAINLTCVVDGDPFPKVFWVKDGSRNISRALYHHDNRTLVIRHGQIDDEGEYQCLAENRARKSNKTIKISVLAPSRIYTFHPSPTVFRRGAVNQTIDCYGNGYPKPSISWLRSHAIIPSVLEVTANDTNRVVQVVKDDISLPLQNVTSRLYLRTSGLTYKEAGNYSCQVSNKVSTALRIVEILFFPIIDVKPSYKRVLEGANITFTCKASGVPHPSVTWLFDGRAVPWNHAVVNGSLMLWNVRNKVHEGNYTCVAKSRAGQTNYTAQLVIHVPPRILEVSGNRTYLINTKILLTCNVTGDPVPSVSWMRPGAKPISFNRTLVIDKAGLDDEGEYLCVAINRVGNTSYRVFVTIQALVNLYVCPPIRRSYLQGDQNVTIECQANGYPKPSINWLFNGRPVPRVGDVYPNHTSQVVQVTWDKISEKLQNVTSRLFVRVDGISISDAGNYTCNASNGVGDGPRLQTVEILFRPEIQQVPKSKTVLADTNVTFFCNASGVPEPTITWTFSQGRVRSSEVTLNSLVLPYVQNTDSYEGEYTCNASNIVGMASASTSLTIHTVPKITIPLQATLIIERGTSTNLTCQSSGDPEPKYRWYKSRRLITQNDRLVNGNKTLLLSNVTFKDEGRYTCEAYNNEGNDTTSTNITVHAVPVILQSLPLVSGIIENNTLHLSCSAESIPPPNVTWLLNGSLVTNDSRAHFVIRTSGLLFVKNSTLTITRVRYADRGTYQCVFRNYRGVASTTSTLEVYVPSRIVTPLTDRTYPKGSTLNMTCRVTGEPYPSVYWFKSGSRDIPRAQLSNRNTTLVISDVRFEDRGEYQCVAVNKGGNDSSTTTIVITVPTSVEITRPFPRVYRRNMTNINITCYAIGFPKPTLEWRRYGARVPVVLSITEVNKNDTVQIIRDDVSGVQNLMKMYSVLYLRPAGISYDEAGNYTCVANRSIDGMSAQQTIEVLFLPEFDVTPRTQIVAIGSNVTFSCSASGVPSPVISWFFNGKPITAPSNSSMRRDIIKVFLVQNTAAYEGQYTCSATSRAGTSNYTASLAVDVEPVVIDLIGNTTVLSGSKINLTCVVRGDPAPRVLWMKNGSMISPRAYVSKDTYSLIIEKAVFEDRGVYQCTAVNRASNDSRQVLMTVLVPPMVYVQTPLPRVFKQNQSNVYIDCYGNGYPKPSVFWSINNTVIPIIPSMTSNYSRSTVQIVNQIISHPMDNVTSRLYLRKAGLTFKEAGSYSCSAVNGIGSPSVRIVEVLFFPEFEVSPSNKVVLERSSVLFKCAVSGVPRPSVTWYFSGGSLPSSHTVKGNNLFIPDVRNNASYEGNYTCVGRSRAGTANYTAQLVVHVSPVMVVSLNDTLVVERGNWVTLFCKAAGDPEPAYRWTKDGVTLTGTKHVRFQNNSQILVLTNVTTKYNGVYKCLAYNVEGNVSTSTNLTVHAKVSMMQGLPAKTEILERKALSLTCKADSIPLPSVNWYRNGQEIKDGANGRWKILSNSADSTLTSTISLENVSYNDRGDFSCAFSNYRGNARSTGRVVVQVPPAIILPPSSVSRLLNKHVTFSCSVRGFPEPTITWSKDGVSLSQSDHISISHIWKKASIKLTSYLNIVSTLRNDTGDYICNASNFVGADTRTASLTILEKPDRPALLVASLTATTALLQWNITFDGNSPIRYYTISYNSIEGAYSINITADQPREHMFTVLLPATRYIFLVTASNDIGTSIGRESLGTTLESVPWQPRDVYAQSLSSTSVFVNWTTPTRTNGILTRYVVFIRPVNQTEKETNVTVGPSVTRTTIHGLRPYTSYEGEVRAYTKIGGGNRSLSFDAVLTFEDLPDAPSRLRVTQFTSTSITLLWMRPTNMNGILKAYRITVRKINFTMILNVTQDISDDSVTYTVTGLRPYTIYNITVFAVTINSGNGSNTIVTQTDEDKPGEPRNIKSKFDGEMYQVTWLPPLTPNGVIIDYKVLFKLLDVVSDAENKEFTAEGGRTDLKIKLTDLNGDKTYEVRVQAKTSKGYGRNSTSYVTIKTPVTNPPEPETPSQTPEVTISTAIINIPKFSDVNGKIKFYGIINLVIPKGTQGQLKDPASYKEEDLVSYCVAHQSKTPAAYLAFRFDASEYDKFKVFVLGKGQGTKCSMRVARASDTPIYYNGPLMSNTEYKSFSRGYTSEKTFSQSGFFGFTTQRKSSEPGGGGGGGGTAAAVSVVIVILLVVVIAVALYFYRRKKRNAPPVEEEERELNEIGKPSEEPLYDNLGADAPTQRLPIPVEDLKSYYLRMHADSDHLFDEEYKSIPSPMGVTTKKCDLPINKPKNRYGNIRAYDHSRVVLSTDDNEPGADYINANYIDGYTEKNKYIATIGPKESTCGDFWRMVWEQKSSIIVMLTKPEESGKTKCHRYWPEESSTFDRITVQLEEKEELADFEIRTFSLQMLSQPQIKPRRVVHFFFTSWPDHDVPDYATGLLEFWKRVKKHQNTCHEKGPMVVHCSAGVGRTGTFIVIDAMMEQIHAEGELDVLSYVTKIRSQRNYMVQRSTQYAFIHYALLEAVTFGQTEIEVQDLRTTLGKLEKRGTQTEVTGMEKQFELLNGVVPDDTYDFVTAVQPTNAKKNRFSNILPFDRTRVVLSAVPGKEDTTYINASYLEGYQEKIGYIATQAPLLNTVADFWKMVWETEVYCIVMLCQLEEPTKVPYVKYWPDKDSVAYETLLVETRKQQAEKEWVIREFNVTNTQTGEVRKILQFNYLDWPEHRLPTNLLSVIDLIGAIQKAKRQHAHRPIVVHCSNGIGRTGAFCTLFSSLERVKLEGCLDVFITARMLRTQRPGMIETLDQYRMCYQAILAYLDSFEESQYQNFM